MSDSLWELCKILADEVKSAMQNDKRVMEARKQDGSSAAEGYF